jgi:sirohydrochlorin ferrochelatase
MTAPALITTSHHLHDPRTARTVAQLTARIARMRPDLRVTSASLGPGSDFDEVVRSLAADGHTEIVVVPLLFAAPHQVDQVAVDAATRAAASHDDLRIEVTRVLGIDAAFLQVLDQRLRAALSRNRVRELDGLVLAGEGSDDPLVRASISRAARAWGQHHRLPTVAAFAQAAPPAAGEAVRALRADGRRHIAVGLMFLAPDQHTDRVTELALEAGATAVAEPLGADEEIARVVLARYAVGAVDLVPLGDLVG